MKNVIGLWLMLSAVLIFTVPIAAEDFDFREKIKLILVAEAVIALLVLGATLFVGEI